MKPWKVALITLAVVVALCGCGFVGLGALLNAEEPPPAVGEAAPFEVATEEPVAPPPAPSPEGDKSAIPEGMSRVGTQVQPGTYRATPTSPYGCYWARLKDASGDYGTIIANGIAKQGEQVVVTIKPGDGYFTSKRCGPWEAM